MSRMVIGRRVGEKILIGKEITVQLHEIRGNGVRIVVEAPPDIQVIRPTHAQDTLDREENIARRERKTKRKESCSHS